MLMFAESPGAGGGRVQQVLVVEDQFIVAKSLVQLLEDYGVKVIGPAQSVKKAMALLDSVTCDAAVLDINLGNETVEPVAERLEQSGMPYFFVSGYASPKLMNPKFKSRTLLHKPVDPAMFRQKIAEALSRA